MNNFRFILRELLLKHFYSVMARPRLLIATMLVVFGWTNTNADTSGSWGNNINYNYNSTTRVLTLSGYGDMKEVTSRSSYPWYNLSIKELVVSSGITSIAPYAFQGAGITKLTFPTTLIKIGKYAFERCYLNDAPVVIPEGVTLIDMDAFHDSDMNSLSLPASLDSLGYEAFYSCSDLVTFSCKSTKVKVGDFAFQYCRKIPAMYNSDIFFHLSEDHQGEYTIPSGIKTIASSAFTQCKELTSITLPASVTNIVTTSTGKAIGYNAKLASINVHAESETFASLNGILYDKSLTTLVRCPQIVPTDIAIPTSVTKIADWSCAWCVGVPENVLSSSVTEIGHDAFYEAKTPGMIIPESVTYIGKGAFESSTLSYVTLPHSITKIGKRTFIYCENLASVEIPNSVTSIEEDAFNNTGLTSVIIPSSVASIGQDAFRQCPLETVEFESATINVENSAFQYIKSLREVVIKHVDMNNGVPLGNFSKYAFSSSFDASPILYVPSAMLDYAKNNTPWSEFNTVVALTDTYTVEVASSDETMGTVTGAGEYEEGAEVTLTAIPSEGYEFVQWSDGTTENPYVFIANEDKNLIATFQKINKEEPTNPENPDGSDNTPTVLSTTDISTLPYALYFNDVEHRAGDFPLELNMKCAEENITAFQCDVYLPEGVIWKSTTDKRGKVTYDAPVFNEDRTDASYHTIAPMAKNADGSYNIIVYSMDKETILETDGALLTLPLEISEEMEAGDYNIIVRNIVMTNVDTQQTKVAEVVSRLTIPSYQIGDANGDDEINVTDIVYIISHIRNESPEGFILAAADVNEDTEVNVTDIVGVIDLIRGGGAANSAHRAPVRKAAPTVDSNLEVVPFTAAEGTTAATVQLDMNNPGEEFTAFQCDVVFPTGIGWAYTVDKRGNVKYTQPTFNAEVDRTDATYHTVSTGLNQADGSMNIIVYSMDKEVFLDEEGAILDMPFVFDADLTPGVYDVVLKNIVMTRADNTQFKPANYTFSIMVGEPAAQVLALNGHFTNDAVSDFNSVLGSNTAACVVDLSAANVTATNALTLGNTNALIYVAEGTALANTQNVVVGDECENLVLTDGYDFHAPVAFEAKNASYSRTVAQDGWYSLVLPFAAEIPAGVTVEKFQSLDEANSMANFAKVMTMEGNVPYIFEATAGAVAFEAQNVAVAATPAALTDGAFTGTYATTEAGSVTGQYALRADGTGFGICDATAYVPAFRAYLQAAGGASNIRIALDGVTAIQSVATEANVNCYDLSGRHISSRAKGVVIINNVKQIKK